MQILRFFPIVAMQKINDKINNVKGHFKITQIIPWRLINLNSSRDKLYQYYLERIQSYNGY